MERIIYVDHSATTNIKNEVLDEMLPYMKDYYGNASSLYKLGQKSLHAINKAREKVAKSIGVQSDEIYFTSGGSEANNMIIKGIAFANRHKGNHIITTKIEHPSVLETCKYLEKEGFEITYLDVDNNGLVSPEIIRRAIKDTTILVSIMFANNEIGTIEPIAEIARITKFKGIYFHTDAVQAVGNIPIDADKLGIDALSMSAHKFYGPKGIGAAYIKKGIKFSPLINGGHQEKNKRAGTENIPAIVGMGKAIEMATESLTEYNNKLLELREYTILRIENEIPNCKLNGDRENRLSGNINFSFKGIDGTALLLLLDIKGIYASNGSACSSGSPNPSHVLKAIGVGDDMAAGSIRFSFGAENTLEDCKLIVDTLKEVIYILRRKNK